jgi:GNAT superfamily N-acetyltransferase
VREAVRILAESHRYEVFLAVSSEGEALGFAKAAVRHDYVNGCDRSPVLFLEGIYVVPDARRQGIAGALCKSIERWGMRVRNLHPIARWTMSVRMRYTVRSVLMRLSASCFFGNVR